MARSEQRPDCLHCDHYVVTWDADKPRGCNAYEFKSVEMPAEVVLASSGEPCKLFEPKVGPGGRARLLRRR